MYSRILVPLENSHTDQCIIEHATRLALHCKAVLVVIHVADGWAARNIQALSLRESEEMRIDRDYIERVAAGLREAGVEAEAVLATGDPASEITATADRERCDLIAMGTHGHRFIADVVYGSVANSVRHQSRIPVLLVRAPAASTGSAHP